MSVPERALAPVVQLPPRRGPVRAALAAARPRQWTKNLLVLAGIVFAAEVGDATRWLQALAAPAAYCAASGAAYLLNDVRDAPEDRLHPVKRLRPIARGELSERAAARLGAVLVLVALAIAAALGPLSLLTLATFLGLQLAYSTALKRVPIVDVLAIAALFVLRAAAGALAVHVRISPWLLVCTGLLALFLALGKRRAELVLVAGGRQGRASLDGYSLPLLDQLLAVAAGAAIVTYVLYTLTARPSAALAATVPLVVFGVLRYVFLLHRRAAGEEPENVLLGDRPILATVALWAVACAAILVLVPGSGG